MVLVGCKVEKDQEVERTRFTRSR